MILLALSCLQGLPQLEAARQLWALGVDGLQLTPGCAPSPGLADWLEHECVPITTHQGFSLHALRAPVWSDNGELLCDDDSVHPPRRGSPAASTWLDSFPESTIVETMYPGYCLGDWTSLNDAMNRGLRLAVDISHLYLQRSAEVINDPQIDRVLNYDRVAEVHVSANNGRTDQHLQPDANTYLLDWARFKSATTPVVIECYLHRLDQSRRRELLDLI